MAELGRSVVGSFQHYASDEEKMVGTKAEQVRVAVGDMAESLAGEARQTTYEEGPF
jgi:hypothetical protein